MSLTRFLIHSCTIQRATITRDLYGAEVEAFADLHTGQACRLITRSERLASGGIGQQIIETYQLILPASLDVTTKDRVSSVTLEDESSQGPFDIEAVVPRRDHRKVRLLALELDRVE